MRHLRATLLLRLVVMLGCAALVVAVVLLGASTGWTATAAAVAVAVWFLGVEAGLFVVPLERLARRSATARGGPVESVWFVDVDEQRRRARERFEEDTRDNPTIR